MRYIEIPEPLQAGGQEFGVRDLIRAINDRESRFNADGAGVRASCRIDAALDASEGRPYVRLTDDDWQRLCDALQAPSCGFPVTPARVLVPFIDAITGARDEPPPPRAG